jgi:hypothetical protein
MPRNYQLSLEEALLAEKHVPVNQAFAALPVQPRQIKKLIDFLPHNIPFEGIGDHTDILVRVNEQARLHALEMEVARLQNQLVEAQRAAMPAMPRGIYVEAAQQPPVSMDYVIDPAGNNRSPAFDIPPLKQVTGIDE